MSETESGRNLRLALEETNKWLRHIESYYWIVSSFWMGGSGYAVFKAINWKGKDGHILLIGIITIVAWILFFFYSRFIQIQSLEFLSRANHLESKLSIDILPEKQNKYSFFWLMKYVTGGTIIIMSCFIVQYIIYLNWKEFFHCLDFLLHKNFN